MQTKNIVKGAYYKVKLTSSSTDTVRIEDPHAPRRFQSDTATVEGTRFQLRGAFTIRVRPAQVIERVYPDARTLKIMELMEQSEDLA